MKNRWHSDISRSCGYNVSTAMVKDWKKKKQQEGIKRKLTANTLCVTM